MDMSFDDAVAIQKRNEDRIMALRGVRGIGVKTKADGLVLEIMVDPAVEMPDELQGATELEGLPVVIERTRPELQ